MLASDFINMAHICFSLVRPASVGDDVAVVGFGMTNTKTRDHSDLLQKADLKVKYPQSCLLEEEKEETFSDCRPLAVQVSTELGCSR